MMEGWNRHTSRSGPRQAVCTLSSSQQHARADTPGVWQRALYMAAAQRENTQTFLWWLQCRWEWRWTKISSTFVFTGHTADSWHSQVSCHPQHFSTLFCPTCLFNYGLQKARSAGVFERWQELQDHFRWKSVLGETWWSLLQLYFSVSTSRSNLKVMLKKNYVQFYFFIFLNEEATSTCFYLVDFFFYMFCLSFCPSCCLCPEFFPPGFCCRCFVNAFNATHLLFEAAKKINGEKKNRNKRWTQKRFASICKVPISVNFHIEL